MDGWNWQPIWAWLITTGWEGLKTTGAIAGLVSAGVQIYDRFEKIRAAKRAVEPVIEAWQEGWLDPDVRRVALVIRNSWRAAALVETVAIVSPVDGRIDGHTGAEPRRELEFAVSISPAESRVLQFQVVKPVPPELFEVTITLRIVVRLKGNEERIVTREIVIGPVSPKTRQEPPPQRAVRMGRRIE
jgi:hypothetical protein